MLLYLHRKHIVNMSMEWLHLTANRTLPNCLETDEHNIHKCLASSSTRVFSEVTFGIPRNTEFYTELTLFRVIPRNSAEFFTVQYREIPRNSAEFRVSSCIQNSVNLQMKIQLGLKRQCHKIFRLWFFLLSNNFSWSQ